MVISEFTSERGGLSVEVIKKAFSATEEEFLRFVNRAYPSQPRIASVGSCCLLGAIANNELFVANLGDSRAVLGRRVSVRKKESVVAERLTTDHNVSTEEIRKEVEALHPDDSHIVVYTRGVWRIKGIIQVSRSIGDFYLKKPELSRDTALPHFVNPIPLRRAVMTAEPSIIRRKLEPEDLYLIFASDGLWEQLSDQAVVEIVSRNPRTGIAKRLVKAALQVAAKKRELRYSDIKDIERGIRRHFHDDISVVVLYLDQHKSNGSNARFKSSAVSYTNAPADIYSFNSDST